MSKDIRAFFASSRKATAPVNPANSPANKRKVIQILSDDEVPSTPKEKVRSSKGSSKRRRIVDDSDDESSVAEKAKKTSNLSQLSKNKSPRKRASPRKKASPEKKQVDIASVFASKPKRVERKIQNARTNTLKDTLLASDDEFERSIIDIDEITKQARKRRTPVKNSSNEKVPPNKVNTDSQSPANKRNTSPNKRQSKKTPSTLMSENNLQTPKSVKRPLSEVDKTPDLNQSVVGPSPASSTIRKRDLNASVLSDEERHERKRVAAVLYQKFKNRQSVINPGSKEVPKGKPNCLAGLSFLVTGILESIEREEAQSIIKDLGGKISSTVGKRLNFMVVGEEAGPKKLAMAEELGVKIISEDELFDLIRAKSGLTTTTKKVASKSPINNRETKIKEVKKEKKENNSYGDSISNSIKRLKRESPRKLEIKIERTESGEKIKSEIKEEQPIVVNEENQAWVDKYKPTSSKQIIGQQGAASNCAKLTNWLSKWYSNRDGKKKLQKPNPWAKNDDGSFYKAALLSGPPGVGKTTTATIVCKELGFDAVEFNASDTRSKKLLKEEVSELLSNKSLFGYFHGKKEAVTEKHVLIMDEVDGMAGNEDRGGIQELISLIKDTSVPIICMCNDRNHQKMRSLVNYCYDLRFNKPRLEQIKGAALSICHKEKIKIPPAKIEEIISATNNDIRQTLNHLSLLSAGKSLELSENKTYTAAKDLKLGPWEVVRKVFSAEEHKKMSMNDKSGLFFHDYSLSPLFVQQNYLAVSPNVPKSEVPKQIALTANSLSLGDLIDKRIRSQSAWSLLPVQAMFSSVMPGHYMAGHFTGQISFPGWLGKNSKTTKRKRLAQEIYSHTRARTSASRLSIRMDYAPILLNAIALPLKVKGIAGVEESLNVIKEYRLLREDIDTLVELTTWPAKKSIMDSVDGKVKAALTRAYNKEVLAYTYSAVAGVKKKKVEEIENNLEFLDEEENANQISDEEKDDNLESDALIKAKKKPVSKAGGSKTEKKTASTFSKGRGGKAKN